MLTLSVLFYGKSFLLNNIRLTDESFRNVKMISFQQRTLKMYNHIHSMSYIHIMTFVANSNDYKNKKKNMRRNRYNIIHERQKKHLVSMKINVIDKCRRSK